MFDLQITDSQAETLEYEVAEALQDLITKNAKDNMIGDLSMDYPVNAVKDTENNMVRVCDCVSVVFLPTAYLSTKKKKNLSFCLDSSG